MRSVLIAIHDGRKTTSKRRISSPYKRNMWLEYTSLPILMWKTEATNPTDNPIWLGPPIAL
jgi:hypothetical protein